LLTVRRVASPVITIAVTIALTWGVIAAAADGGGVPVRLAFAKNQRLFPTLHATQELDSAQIADGHEYDYVASGVFRFGLKVAARLPDAIRGHAAATPENITIHVSRAARHAIRARATILKTRKVTLALTYRATRTDAGTSASPITYTDEVFSRSRTAEAPRRRGR
jgi:hypothetical protein